MDPDPPPDGAARPRGRSAAESSAPPKKYSPTDPDATLTTSCKQYRMEPCYKQHTAVDDRAGVIVDVEVSTGEASEGQQLPQQLARVEAQTGVPVQTLTADGAYAHGRNYEHLEQRGTLAVIPPPTEPRTARRIPARRFKYDARQPCVRCPAGKVLRRSVRNRQGWVYRARACDCRACPLRARCISPSAAARVIVIGDGYEALLRARRKRARWGASEHTLYARQRWRAEGLHGEAKTCHGLRRAARRGCWNVAIQVYLTAAVLNLKRLAALRRALRVTVGYEVYGVLRGVPCRWGFTIRMPSCTCLAAAA